MEKEDIIFYAYFVAMILVFSYITILLTQINYLLGIIFAGANIFSFLLGMGAKKAER